MVPAAVSHLSLSNAGFVVILKPESDPRSVPIFIGMPEAQAIAIPLNHIQPSRPLTHDLLKNVVENLDCHVGHVEIREIRDGTYFAGILLQGRLGEIFLDARPSDAIALALRCEVPIMIDDAVIEESGVIIQLEEEQADAAGKKDSGRLETVSSDPRVRLKARMAVAIREERYEDAARIRDELRQEIHHTLES